MYEATAFVVISPVSDCDGSFARLSILRESNDPARNLETLAKVIKTAGRRDEGQGAHKGRDSPRELLEDVELVPVAQSDLLSITATSSGPKFARRLASALRRGNRRASDVAAS